MVSSLNIFDDSAPKLPEGREKQRLCNNESAELARKLNLEVDYWDEPIYRRIKQTWR